MIGGLLYASNGDDTSECVVHTVAGFFEDCLILADDFRQYYLGAFARTSVGGVDVVEGIADPIDGFEGTLGGPAVGDNPIDEAGVFTPTSQVLPAGQFPQFASQGAAEYPFGPVEGTRYAEGAHADDSYMRLTRTTVDLTDATSAQLQFQLLFNTEPSYDNVIVEAHTPGQDDWTTLPDVNGNSQSDPAGGVPAERVPAQPAPVPAPLPRRSRLHRARHERRDGTPSPARPVGGSRWRSTCPPSSAGRSSCLCPT